MPCDEMRCADMRFYIYVTLEAQAHIVHFGVDEFIFHYLH